MVYILTIITFVILAAGVILLVRHIRKDIEIENTLSLILNKSIDGIIIIDSKGIIQTFSNSAELMFGYSKGEVIGKNISILMPEQFAAEHDQYLERYVNYRAPRAMGVIREISGKRKDYSVFPIEIGLSEINNNGKLYFLGMVKDITKRKQATDALENHHKHLQELVEVQTRDLKAAKEKAEIANKTKSEFLSNISHELRTPMHAILSFSRQAMSRTEDLQMKEFLADIHTSGNRLTRLLNNLLDLSKMEDGKMQLNCRNAHLYEITSHSSRELEALIKEKNVNLSIKPAEDLRTAFIDPEMITQVIINLLSNAIKFTPAGKNITIEIANDKMQFIDSNGASEIDAIKFAISDQGIGIPPGELELVFDKFAQSTKTKTGAGGTGLGLSICKEIINLHGGNIWADNNADGGAIFTFVIPIKKGE